MKKFIALTLCFCVLSGALASNKMPVCLGEFKNKTSAPKKIFDTLIDRMTNSIINTRKFSVIDNARLKEAITEQSKIDSGISDTKDAPQKGKIKSAGFILYGTVLSLGYEASATKGDGYSGVRVNAKVELNVRFMDAETGEAKASKTIIADVSKSTIKSEATASESNLGEQALQAAIEKAACEVTEKLMDLAFPTMIIKVSKRNVTINMTEERAEKGMLLEVFEVGEDMKDPDTGESLGADEELLGELKITRVSPRFAKAKPLGDLKVDDLEEGMIIRPVSQKRLAEKAAAEKKKKKSRFSRRF
jgi:curli biogenesis system outer membrane secretion channel CsgG